MATLRNFQSIFKGRYRCQHKLGTWFTMESFSFFSFNRGKGRGYRAILQRNDGGTLIMRGKVERRLVVRTRSR